MTRRPALLALFLITGFVSGLAGCATTGVNAGDFNIVSLEDEWKLGREIEADVNRQVRLVNDPALQRYVEEIGQGVVQKTELGRLPWRFHIVQDDAINAFNIPGGVVYIHSGLIAESGSAGELAGVIAHEVAHGVARHGTERLTTQYGLSAVAGLVLGNDPGLVEQIAAQVVAGGAVARYSRSAEREADKLGVAYMARSGWDPEGLAQMLERLRAEEQGRGGVAFFATHPAAEERVQNVRAEARAYRGKRLRSNDGSFAAMRARAARY